MTTAPDFAIADKLREARALVERGWCQKVYERGPKDARSYCSLGAISASIANHHWPQGAEITRPLALAIGGLENVDIVNWNDAPERTQAEVLAAFDRAIELASPSQ